jgi:hypothetical protein
LANTGRLLPHHEFDLGIQDVQQLRQLVERFLVVCLIEQPVELRRGRAQPANQLPLAQSAALDAFLCGQGELVKEQVSQITGISIVFQHVIDVDCPLLSRFQNIGERLVG